MNASPPAQPHTPSAAADTTDGASPLPTPGGGGDRPVSAVAALGPAAFYGIALAVVAVDQAVKAWVRAAMPEHSTIPLWPDVFHLTHTQNRGMAFSLLEGAIPLLAGAALLVIGVIIAAQAKMGAKMPRLMGWALSLPLGGAVGNLIDRLWHRQVTDMFDFRLINFPVFNVADAAITVGVVLLAWRTLTAKEPESSPGGAAPPAPAG